MLSKDPTLLEDFRGTMKTSEEEPPRKPRKTNPISPMIFTDHTNLFLHANLNPSFPGYMGGASAFENMTGFILGMSGAGPYPTYGGYGSSGLGSSGASLGHMGAGGFMDGVGATFGSMGNAFLRPHPYDNLTPMGPLKDYKEGGSSVKFKSFNGESYKKRALSFVQQFHGCEVQKYGSKIRYEQTVLKFGKAIREKKFDKGTVDFLKHVNSNQKYIYLALYIPR